MDFKILTIALCLMSSLASYIEAYTDPAAPATNTFTVTNQQGINCVILSGGLQLRIPYTFGNKNETFKVNVKNSTTVSGNCGKDEDTLILSMDNSWSLSFVFSNTSAQSYSMKSINFAFKVNGTNFPTTTNGGTLKKQTTILPNATNTAPHSGYYTCSGETTLTLSDGISLHLYDIKYMAFGQTNSTSFPSNVQSCKLSLPAPDTDMGVAIGVGIALGTMITVVIVLYIIVSKASGL